MQTSTLLPVFLLLTLGSTFAACGSSDDATGDATSGGGGNGGTETDAASEPEAAGGGGGTLDPGVISTSGQSAIEAETHVAAAPNGYVAAAWIAIGFGGNSVNGYRFSKDDGLTWEAVDGLASPGNRVASDPVLAVDSKSNFYMTWIGFVRTAQGQASDMHVYVATAPAGTTKFGAPIEVSVDTAEFDKPWITVEPDDSILLTYAETSTGGIIAARSTDQGQIWDNATIVQDGGFRNLVFPCHDASGSKMFVAYHAGGGIGLRWSEDGGVTWPDANKSAMADQADGQPAFDDPTCAVAGDEVWVSYGLSGDAFGQTASPKLDAIKIAHSSDGGKTVDARYDALDTAAGSYGMHPYLAREDGGALDLVYYSGSSDGDTSGSFRWSRSTDGGKTWGASQTVRAPVTYLTSRSDQRWVGDYPGLWWARGNLYMAYVDNASGSSHVGFYRAKSP